MVNWYVWIRGCFVACSGFMFGYESGSVNGVKEMDGFRQTFNISYIEPDDYNGTSCSASDDVETSAFLGIVVSTYPIGGLFGALLAGTLSDFAGRKAAFITGAVIYTIGGGLQTGAVQLWMLFLGRLLAGFGNGILLQVSPLYVAETSPKELRGRLVCVLNSVATTGFVIGNSINAITRHYNFGWRISLCVEIIAGLYLLVGMFFLPESPRWLAKKHKEHKALKVLKRVHKDEMKALQELKEINLTLKDSPNEKFIDTLRFLCQRKILERVLLGLFLHIIGRFLGNTFFAVYSVSIFCRVDVDGFTVTVVIGVSVWLTQFIALATVDRVGRKPILLLGSLVMCISLAFTATLVLAFKLEEPSEDGLGLEKRVAGYFTVFFMVLFSCAFVMSFGIIPFVVTSEIYPLRVRGITVALTISGWWGGMIINDEISPILISSPLGIYGTFYLFSGICLFSLFYVLLLLPETKGQSLEKIELLFAKPLLERSNVLYYLKCACCCECKSNQRSTVLSEDAEPLRVSYSSGSDSTESLNSIQGTAVGEEEHSSNSERDELETVI